MFRAKTVFIIGAGASAEVGLPIGSTLLLQIAESIQYRFDGYGDRPTKGDPVILEVLKLRHGTDGAGLAKINAHIDAAYKLAASATQALSIDNVIDAWEDSAVEAVGKIGIARAILQAEAASAFFRTGRSNGEIDLKSFGNTWYSRLSKILTEGVRRSNVSQIFENVEFIIFNYDRCLEWYLLWSISQYYGLKIEEASSILARLNVHRPYGSVGGLPQLNSSGNRVRFGDASATAVASTSESIRTFTEQYNDPTALAGMHRALQAADRIIFLGFGFHRQNIQLLRCKTQSGAAIFGTAAGVSSSDASVITAELQAAFSSERARRSRGPVKTPLSVTLSPHQCGAFFDEYWRTLTAERF